MIKEKILPIFLFSIFNYASAKELPDHPNTISVGYGAGAYSSTILFNLNYSALYRFIPTGPFYLKYDYKIASNTSLGINVGWLEAKYSFDCTDSTNTSFQVEEIHRSFCALLRANYIVWHSKRFEFYTGAGLGFVSQKGYYRNEVKDVFIYESVSPGFPFSFELTFGERLYVTKNLGIYAEVGVAKSVFQGGIAYKF